MADMTRLEKLELQRAQIEARIKAEKQKASAAERKARNHALMVIGGLVVSHAAEGDWKRIDMNALAAWLDKYGYKVEKDCFAKPLPTKEAANRLRLWERGEEVNFEGDDAAEVQQ